MSQDFLDQIHLHFPTINLENKVLVKGILSRYPRKDFHKRTFSLTCKFKHRSTRSKNFWKERGWTDEEAVLKIKEIQQRVSRKIKKKIESDPDYKQSRIDTYAKVKERQIKDGSYDRIRKSKGNGSRVEYWIGKINPKTDVFYTEDEARELIREHQGIFFRRIWKTKKTDENAYPMNTSIEYYLTKGMNLTAAREALSERQATFSLKKCIERHGNEKGLEIFNARQKKWQKTLNDKTEEEKIEILQKKIRNFKRYSKSSFRLFADIEEEIGESMNFYYGENEFFLWDKKDKRIYFYDLFIKELNLIVEFHGIMFHPKRELSQEELKNWTSLFTNLSGIEVRIKDDKKKKLAIDTGYEFLELWEDDIYKKQTLLDFIKKLKEDGKTINKN